MPLSGGLKCDPLIFTGGGGEAHAVDDDTMARVLKRVKRCEKCIW
jgi:hypothetical protein